MISLDDYNKARAVVSEYETAASNNKRDGIRQYHIDFLAWTQREIEKNYDNIQLDNHSEFSYATQYCKNKSKSLYVTRPADVRQVPPRFLDAEWDIVEKRVKELYPCEEVEVVFGESYEEV